EIRAVVVEFHRQRPFRGQRHLPPAGPALRRVVDAVLDGPGVLQLARRPLRLARLLRGVGILRLVHGPQLDARADRVLPRLAHGHVVDAGLQVVRLRLLPRLTLRDRLVPAPFGEDADADLRLRIDGLRGRDQGPGGGQLVAEGRDVVVVLVRERHVLLLAEGAVHRLFRHREPGRRREGNGAHVASGHGEGGEEKKGAAVSLHGSPLPDPYSRPYFFGLFPMMAAARICGTYSSVSCGSFFRRYRCQKSRLSLRNPPGCWAISCSTRRIPFSPLL